MKTKGHHLQISDTCFPSKATCSCGEWSLSREYWERKDGNDIRDDAWSEFENHAIACNPNATRCQQVVGWHSNIHPKDRNSTNLSNGAIFSSRERANAFVQSRGMTILSIRPIMLDSSDPQIDYFS